MPAPFRDVLIVLPGILGSVLEKDRRPLWDASLGRFASAIVSGRRDLRTLTLRGSALGGGATDDGIVATRLVDDLHLIPGFWKIDGYSTLREALHARYDLRDGENYFELPYDWRLDNRVAAGRLDSLAKEALPRWRSSSGADDARVVLVAHSMGGLVSRYFLERLGGWKIARALITFGTPYRGSLNALDTLSNGARHALGLVDLSEFARSCTSIYQLLPTFACVEAGGTWVRPGETHAIPNLDPARAADALAFHREIESARAANALDDEYRRNGYRIFPIVGLNQDTWVSASVAANGVTLSRVIRGQVVGGDGTVPRVSATPVELGDEHREAYFATRHASLQNAEAVLEHLDGVLSSNEIDLDAFRDARIPLSLTIPDACSVGDRVPVRVSAERNDLSLSAVARARAKDLVRVPLRFDPADGGSYFTDLPPLPEGAIEIRVEGDRASTVQDAMLVMSVPPRRSRSVRTEEGLRRGRGSAAGGPTASSSRARRRSSDDFAAMRAEAAPESSAADGEESGGDDDMASLAVEESATAEPPVPPTIDTILSADAPSQLSYGQEGEVRVRMELEAGAKPLGHSAPATMRKDADVMVVLSVRGAALTFAGESTWTTPPPAAGAAREGSFTIRGLAIGTSHVVVVFLQSGRHLGTIEMPVTVVKGASSSRRSRGGVTAQPVPADGARVLTLMVQRWPTMVGECLQYTLTSPRSTGRQFVSAAFVDSSSKTPVRDKVNALAGKLVGKPSAQFASDILDMGKELGAQLFDADLRRVLWEERADIDAIHVLPLEPHVPWELVLLQDADLHGVDDRFLGEYGMVRHLSGRTCSRSLPLSRWAYCAARYEQETPNLRSLDTEMSYFTDDLPARGIHPRPLAPDPSVVLETLNAGDFDVLHVACHGSGSRNALDASELLLANRIGDGGTTETLRLEASKVGGIRPLGRIAGSHAVVFLNACETAVASPSITEWRGWPGTFLDLGADVFVGTAWPVRNSAAKSFARAFYDALLADQPLWKAASAARSAAKKADDPSWLAFMVHGQVDARKEIT